MKKPANQLTGFSMMATLEFNKLKEYQVFWKDVAGCEGAVTDSEISFGTQLRGI